MLTTLKIDRSPTPPGLEHPGIRLVPLTAGRWRVVSASGLAIGHVEKTATADGPRFSAQRYHAPSRAFRRVGDFWSAADAVDCLRLSR